MDPTLKLVLTIAVFMFSFVWYFRNYAGVMQWINDKIGIEQPKRRTSNTDSTTE